MSAVKHTPGPPDDADIEAANERACRAAAAAHGLTIEQADACDDGEHRCPTCPFRRAVMAKAAGSPA